MMKLELANGNEIELTLNFARLLKVKNNNKKIYEEFMRALKQDKDFDVIFDSIKILYVAYLCANSNDLDNVMNEEEFCEVLPMDMAKIGQLYLDGGMYNGMLPQDQWININAITSLD